MLKGNHKKVIIIGEGEIGQELYTTIGKILTKKSHICGFFDDNPPLKQNSPNYLGTIEKISNFISTNHIDEIYYTLPDVQEQKANIAYLLHLAEKHMIRFYLVSPLPIQEKLLTKKNMNTLSIITIYSEPLQSINNQIIKRLFDIVFSTLFLCIAFPIFYIVFGILIKIFSPGPIFFKQKRTGIDGKIFNCYKFRSMKINKDADKKQAQKNDFRITKIGYFLRQTNLDETPQFYNVLKGDMSIIGPRPHMLKHTKFYSNVISNYMTRHLIKPGITGWAQVNGCGGEIKTLEQMEKRIQYDIWYLENWSFLLDIKIAFITFIHLLKGLKNIYKSVFFLHHK